MKFTKKLMALCLAMLMVVALAACSDDSSSSNNNQANNNTNDGASAYELYTASQEKMAALESAAYDMTLNMNMTVSEGGQTETIAMPITGKITTIAKGGNDYDMAMLMNIDMSSMGAGEMQTNMYYTDGYMYYDINAMGQAVQMKEAMDLASASQSISAPEMADLEESWIKESSVNGNKLHLVIDGAEMTGYIESMMEMNGGAMEFDSMKLGDVTMDVTLNDEGLATNYAMNLTMAVSAQGTAMDMTMDMTMALTGTDNLTINFPEGKEGFMEGSLS